MSSGMKVGLLASVVLVLSVVGYYTLQGDDKPTDPQDAPAPQQSADTTTGDSSSTPVDPSLTGTTDAADEPDSSTGIDSLLDSTAPPDVVERPSLDDFADEAETDTLSDPLTALNRPSSTTPSDHPGTAADSSTTGPPPTLTELEHGTTTGAATDTATSAHTPPPLVRSTDTSTGADATATDTGMGPTSPRPGPDVFDPFSNRSRPLQVKAVDAGTTTGDRRSYTIRSGDTLGEISARLYGKSSLWRKIAEVNPDIDPNNLPVGRVIKLPELPEELSPPPATEPGQLTGTGAGRVYVVQQGDTPSGIAEKIYGSARQVSLILEANPGLNPNAMRLGQELRIPELPDPTTTTDTAGANRSVDLLSSDPDRPDRMTYTVRSGDTLGAIAKKLYGKTSLWRRIQDANPGVDSRYLEIGQKLVIPEPPQTTSTTDTTTTTDTTEPVIDDPLDIGVDSGARKYTVVEGDNLWVIAEREYGDGTLWRAIFLANKARMKNSNDLRVGQTIIIPPKPQPAATAPEPE